MPGGRIVVLASSGRAIAVEAERISRALMDAGHDGRRNGVGEQVGTRALAQQGDDLLAPLVYPPLAPPRALPRVPVRMSTRPITP